MHKITVKFVEYLKDKNVSESSIKHYKSFLHSANMSEQYTDGERIFAGDILLQYDYALAYFVVAFFKIGISNF